MNNVFPWLPMGVEVTSGASVGRLLEGNDFFQITLGAASNNVILFLKLPSQIAEKPVIKLLKHDGVLFDFSYSGEEFLVSVFPVNETPKSVRSLVESPGKTTKTSLKDLGRALADLQLEEPSATWADAIYIPSKCLCIPTKLNSDPKYVEDRRLLVSNLLVGETKSFQLHIETVRKINPSLQTQDIREFLTLLGMEESVDIGNLAKTKVDAPENFSLPGRPELEQFFREYIIDFFHRFDAYRSMGFNSPNGILLYGPPGSGKSYAVKVLAKFLGWPVFDLDVASIGSPYIHETSRKLKQAFDDAMSKAPAIVLLEEIDALAGKRTGINNDSKVEEVAQLLRLLETSAANGILVIATTNRFEALDSAIVRRGRFDHVIEVGLPTREEIISALTSLIRKRPALDTINLDEIATQLLGHTMSDVAWVVNEAARISVRNSKTAIDQDSFVESLSRLAKSTPRSAGLS